MAPVLMVTHVEIPGADTSIPAGAFVAAVAWIVVIPVSIKAMVASSAAERVGRLGKSEMRMCENPLVRLKISGYERKRLSRPLQPTGG